MDDCNKVQQFITDAVDDRLRESDRKIFENHIQGCSDCRNDYELVNLTKDFVKRNLTRHSTPDNVVQRIKDEIEKRAIAEQPRKSFIPGYTLTRAAVLAMIVVGASVLFYLFNTPDIQNTVHAADIMHQSIENYGLYLSGDIEPAMVGESADDLYNYFAVGLDFPIALKPVKDCEWVAGVMSAYKGLPLVHLFYKLPAGIVYVYQVNWNAVCEGKIISLANGAIASLQNTGWYVYENPGEYNLVLWLHNEKTLCAAVSTLEKNTLKSLFIAEN